MLAIDKEAEANSEVMGQLLQVRQELKHKLDELTSTRDNSVALSNNATTQLAALHREYQRITGATESEISSVRDDAQKRMDSTSNEAMSGGAVLGGLAVATLVTVLTGGVGGLFLGAVFGATQGTIVGAVAGGALSSDEIKKIESERDNTLSALEGRLNRFRGQQNSLITAADANNQELKGQLQTAEQHRLYNGVIAELLLDNGINVARQLHQFAHFNGIVIDDLLKTEDTELHAILDRMLKGQPKATDVDRLVTISDRLSGQNVVTPEIRTLKQFINHVLVPNKTYFDILASFADDIRDKDLSTFPPLEILGHKPISLSGRVQPKQLTAEQEVEQDAVLLDRAKAKVEIRKAIAGNEVYHLMRDSDKQHLEKMEDIKTANENEIASYAGLFAGIEAAMERLESKRAELDGSARLISAEIIDGEKNNKLIDSRIHETRSRNDAKQKAAVIAGRTRGALALAGGTALALLDGGVASGALIAHGGHALAKGAKDSMHSLTYSVGQEISTRVENSALDDYMFSLQLQKADTVALRTELDDLRKAIQATEKSSAFQGLLHDEAKRSQVAETLLLRSLIRNGYNNSLEITETCNEAGVASVDSFLDHYEGTRLGLALKKHCHGIADSNDLSVILAEANCLRGDNLSPQDKALKSYVEETMKPNIASFYSKASKMDVIAQNNLTGFGNELHFSAEMQLETARAVRVLLANEFGMSVIGREDVRQIFDFWMHRHGDRRLYDEKIRDGEMSDEYPDKRVSYLPADRMERFVDMAKRSIASGRSTFPKVGDMFLRVCAHEYFLPQAIQTGGKDNIFTDYPESPSAYPMANTVISEFIRKLSFSDLSDYRNAIGTSDEMTSRLDNLIAQSFMDFFAKLGQQHEQDPNLVAIRNRLKDAANYDDYAPVFDRYTKNITKDAIQKFDLFLDTYKANLEKTLEGLPEKERGVLEQQLEAVKHLADGKLNPSVVRPGTHEARLRAHDESHTGENVLRK